MPYTRFVKHGNSVDVYKREGGKEVKAFTSHSGSLQAAHRTAAIRTAADSGKLKVKADKSKDFPHGR